LRNIRARYLFSTGSEPAGQDREATDEDHGFRPPAAPQVNRNECPATEIRTSDSREIKRAQRVTANDYSPD
jgi:hypothetical protein